MNRSVPAALIVVALLGAACQQRAVNQSLDRSTAPLLVPEGEWRDRFEFTAPPGATDLYQLRWNFSPGATDIVAGWQINVTSRYDREVIAEGPGEAVVAEAIDAARRQDCETVDEQLDVRLCIYDAEFARGGVNAYLVRQVANEVLVIEYNNLDRAAADRTMYDGTALEARFISADFEEVAIDGDIDDYLVYIY